MREEQFIEAIKEKRRRAIESADMQNIRDFANKRSEKGLKREVSRHKRDNRTWMVVLACFLLIVGSVGIGLLSYEAYSRIDQPVTLQQTVIQPVVINITKNEGFMVEKPNAVCIKQPNSTEYRCYEE